MIGVLMHLLIYKATVVPILETIEDTRERAVHHFILS